MHKNKGRAQQMRGQKRRAKVLSRRDRKDAHKMYIVNLMFKYGKDLKIKENEQPGSKYWDWYLNNNDEEKNNG